MQVLGNDGFIEDFVPSRAVRQGDLISPYLFVLTMERLGHAMQRVVSNGKWKPITIGRGGLTVSLVLCR